MTTAGSRINTCLRVVELMGGRGRMIAFVKESTDDMKAGGIAFISHEVTAPTKIETIGKQKFTVLPVTLQLVAAQSAGRQTCSK